jgi:hypothetical protein
MSQLVAFVSSFDDPSPAVVSFTGPQKFCKLEETGAGEGHEERPNVRAFRDWLFSEMDQTIAQWATLTITPTLQEMRGYKSGGG